MPGRIHPVNNLPGRNGRANTGFFDGSVRFLSETVDTNGCIVNSCVASGRTTCRATITWNGKKRITFLRFQIPIVSGCHPNICVKETFHVSVQFGLCETKHTTVIIYHEKG
jgi:prepilin-type processing-associated H-X9-DG protein